MAAVMVLLMGFALLLLTSVVVLRSIAQTGATANDARWEQALYVAESGLNVGALAAANSATYTTGETRPDSFADRQSERAWAVAAADARSADDLTATPEGEYVLVLPGDRSAVYSVGFVPSRGDPNRRVRVVKGDLDWLMVPGPWSVELGLLTGGDIEISGNPKFFGTGVHSNGSVVLSGSVTTDDCLGVSGSYSAGTLYQDAECPYPGGQAPIDIPDVSPRQFWHLSEYDLCPSGAVRAGPAHPTWGNTVTNRPCSGNVLVSDASTPYRGWKFDGCCDSKLGAKWTLDGDYPFDGVYYFYQASVVMSSNPGTAADPWEATILVEGSGSCDTIIGGDVYLGGNPSITSAPGGNSITIIAGRDLEIGGNPDMRTTGIIAAYEQIKLNGNPALVDGLYLAQNACDTVDDYDNLHANYLSGEPKVSNSGSVDTPFSGVVPELGISFWDEL